MLETIVILACCALGAGAFGLFCAVYLFLYASAIDNNAAEPPWG